MEDALVGLPRGDGPGTAVDPIAQWRQAWEQDVAAATPVVAVPEQNGAMAASVAEVPVAEVPVAEAPDSRTTRMMLRRRDYGSYIFVGLDFVLAIVTPFVLSIPLIVATLALFLGTGHHLYAGGKLNGEFAAWLLTPLFLLAGIFVNEGALLLVLWYRLRRLSLGWSTFGLGADMLRSAPGRVGPGRAALVGAGIGLLALVVSDVFGNVLQKAGLDQSGQYRLVIEPLHHASLWIVLAMVAAGTFLAPVVEEAFFRGYVFRAIAVRKGLARAYPISAGTFALLHFFLGGSDILPLVPVLFVIGLFLCFAYRRTGNLLADITAHAVNNGVTFALALLPIHLPF